jgi:uncharacterized protein YggE
MKTKPHSQLRILAAAAFMGISSTAFCQVSPYDTAPSQPQITATGKATLDATADTAQVRFIVECATNDVAAAQIVVNTSITREFAALEYIGVGREEISASAVDVAPVYAPWNGKDATTTLKGFRAKATMNVDLQAEQLGHVPNIVDAVMKTGGARLDGVTFSVSPGSSQRAAVIAQATQDAQTKARAMASALGMQLGSVQVAGDGGITVTPAKTSVESSVNDPLKLEASVTVYYQVSPIVAANNVLPY